MDHIPLHYRVAHVFNILHQELDVAMALCGCRSLDEITPDLVSP